jgi:hypothetical protein
MPALPYQPVPFVAEIKMTYRQGTNLMSNVYHVANSSEWTQADLVDLCNEFYDWENVDAKGDRSIEIELVYITAAALVAPDAPYNARAIDPAVGGMQPFDAAPLNVTIAITAITGTRGRGTQGRTFYIGLAEQNVSQNVVTNTTLDNIMDDYAALLARINGHGGWSLVVVHRFKNKVRLAEGTFSPIVTFGVRDTTVDTQKNRLPNHRRASSRSLEDLCAEVIRRGGSCSVTA